MTSDPVLRTIEAYDRIASRYAKIWFDDPVMEPAINRFLEYVGPNGRIIDVGCGNGRDVLTMEKQGFTVVGIDLSKAMLIEAKMRAPDACFRLMDVRQINFPPGSFDGVWACAVLQHFPSNQLGYIIKQFSNVLKSNGILALSIREGNGESFDEYGRYLNQYSLQEIKSALEEHNFKTERVERNTSEKGISGKKLSKEWAIVFAKLENKMDDVQHLVRGCELCRMESIENDQTSISLPVTAILWGDRYLS